MSCPTPGGSQRGHAGHSASAASWAPPSSVLGPAAQGLPEMIAVQRWIPDLAECDVFLCGPKAWTDGAERLALAAGVPSGRIHSESFGW